MDLSKLHTLYMLGIGGIGMSALARYFHRQGVKVSGYDKTPSPLTDKLNEEGIAVHFDESTASIPQDAFFVYTPAVPKDHAAFDFVRSRGGEWVKRSQLLEAVTKDKKTIAVAGTHGKTTTTAITAHLVHQTIGSCSAFVGGVMSGYESNLITSEDPDYIIVEADEYDRSFLRLHPDIAVVTSLDPDHLDIYGTFDEMKKDYSSFARMAKTLVIHEKVSDLIDHPNKITYGSSPRSDHYYTDVNVTEGAFSFQYDGRSPMQLPLPGRHNVENATAALVVCSLLKINLKEASDALSSFPGVKRRFERVVTTKERVLIDDYAHHPEEIKAVIGAARELFPGKRLGVVFQPHLFSRTRDLEEGFASSLSLADELILVPIYPAREEPIEGVSSAHLLKKVTLKTKQLVEKTALVNAVLSLSVDVVLILGAGDIDRLVAPIAEAIEHEHHVD